MVISKVKVGKKQMNQYLPAEPVFEGKDCSPGLQSRVARQAALPSSLAQQELERNGLKISVKSVDRMTRQCGEDLLTLRRRCMFLSRLEGSWR